MGQEDGPSPPDNDGEGREEQGPTAGTDLGAVCYDFSNVIMVILGYAELLVDDPELPPRARRGLREIVNAATRGAELTRRLIDEGDVGAHAGGGRRVLVVDDDAAVRTLMDRILSARGYGVVAADSGQSGLDALHGEGTFHLVVTDVHMPGMDGTEMVRRLREEFPCVRVLFVSGRPDLLAEARQVTGPGIGYLAKPFSPVQLSAAVDALLA